MEAWKGMPYQLLWQGLLNFDLLVTPAVGF
jgi:hypothetical protein